MVWILAHRFHAELNVAFQAEQRGHHRARPARPVAQGSAVTTTTSPVSSTRVPS